MTLFANLFRSLSIALNFSLPFLFISSLPFIVFFCMELWLANFLGKEKFILQRVADKQRHWQWIFPQNVTFFVSVTLLGLVRISKTRYRWKLFVTLLLTNLLT